MKLKAPPGVGDPCVAGVVIIARDGIYDVDAETGALLLECFGFVEIAEHDKSAGARWARRRRRRWNRPTDIRS